METAKNDLELAAETEGTLSSLSTIVSNANNCLGNHVFLLAGKCDITVGICRNLQELVGIQHHIWRLEKFNNSLTLFEVRPIMNNYPLVVNA